jgi:hypothetical protein
VVLRTSPPSISSITTFHNVPLSSATLTVPQGSKPAYQIATGWKDFGTFVEDETPVAVTSVSLNQTSLNKKVGDPSVSLIATISPSSATNKSLRWSTGNSSVATVSDGTVSFVGVGSTNITVRTHDGNKSATCQVTVTAAGTSGTVGPLSWSYDNGVLTISGTGAMPDYSYTSYAPWYNYRSSITTINIEDGVTTIGNSAFYNCSSLNSVSIGSSVTTIGNYAFNGCSSLASITIGSSVTTIGYYAFSGCSSLTNVTVLRTSPPPIDNNTFYGISLSSATLTVPQGSKPAYQSAVGWKDFGTFVVDGEEEDEEEREVVVEAPKPEGNRGVIAVSLNLPADGSFSCTFTLTLPQGFVLDQSVTALADDLAADYQLDIALLSGNTWQIDISLKSQQNLRAGTIYRNLVDVAYTIDESLPDGNHEVKLTDVELTMSDNTVIREDEIVVNVTTGSPTGIYKASEGVTVRSASGRLYIDSPASETVYIYSFAGKLLYTATKPAGQAIFDAPSEKLLIVRGTSGWRRKVIN